MIVGIYISTFCREYKKNDGVGSIYVPTFGRVYKKNDGAGSIYILTFFSTYTNELHYITQMLSIHMRKV